VATRSRSVKTHTRWRKQTRRLRITAGSSEVRIVSTN
jgi:hypothetical protein